ncbi:MAG: hypothetical protein Gyms2KO_42630 [Gymnodinialimonas sp.]
MRAEMAGGELSEGPKAHDAEGRGLASAVVVHLSTLECAARHKVEWILTAVGGSGKIMANHPQL